MCFTVYFFLVSVLYKIFLQEDLSIPKVDAQKAILIWVETGLASEFFEIRVRTLQGCLFLLQAICFEDLKSVYTLLETFLLENLHSGQVELEFRLVGYFCK